MKHRFKTIKIEEGLKNALSAIARNPSILTEGIALIVVLMTKNIAIVAKKNNGISMQKSVWMSNASQINKKQI